jgi:hypothetical protein
VEYTAGFILKKRRYLATWRIMQVSINKEKRIVHLATWKILQVSPHLRKEFFPPCHMEDTAGFTILKNKKKRFFQLATWRILQVSPN